MSELVVGDTSKTAVSQYAETNEQRAVLAKQVKAGQQTVVAKEPSQRDGGSREVIMCGPSCDLGSRVHVDMSGFPTPNRRSLLSRLRAWYHVSVLRLLVEEVRNLPERTGCALEMRALEIGGYMGSIRTGMGAPLAFESQICKHAYIRYMQQLQMDHPFLSIFDRLLAAQAWKAGSEWDDRTDTLRTQGHCSSIYPEGGNTMPPQATQQTSKRGPAIDLQGDKPNV
jgi:hypothetical protein